MENKIKAVIGSLVDSIEREDEENSQELVEQLLSDPMLDWKNPDTINCLYFFQQNRHIVPLLKRVYPEANRRHISKISFIYQHYDFLNHQVKGLVDLEMGMCADKSRWLIQRYLNYVLTGEKVNIPITEEPAHKYWHPDFGSADEWYEFMESIEEFYYGNVTRFLKAYEVLSKKKAEAIIVVREQTAKINDFYRNIPNKYEEFVNSGKVSASAKGADTSFKLNVLDKVKKHVLHDTLTEEMYVDAINEVINENN